MVELIGCTEGDWEVLIVDNEIFAEGHSIPVHEWLRLISKWDKTKERTISDKAMENRTFEKKLKKD